VIARFDDRASHQNYVDVVHKAGLDSPGHKCKASRS